MGMMRALVLAFTGLPQGSPEPFNDFSDQGWFAHCSCDSKKTRRGCLDSRPKKTPCSQLLQEESMYYRNSFSLGPERPIRHLRPGTLTFRPLLPPLVMVPACHSPSTSG